MSRWARTASRLATARGFCREVSRARAELQQPRWRVSAPIVSGHTGRERQGAEPRNEPAAGGRCRQGGWAGGCAGGCAGATRTPSTRATRRPPGPTARPGCCAGAGTAAAGAAVAGAPTQRHACDGPLPHRHAARMERKLRAGSGRSASAWQDYAARQCTRASDPGSPLAAGRRRFCGRSQGRRTACCESVQAAEGCSGCMVAIHLAAIGGINALFRAAGSGAPPAAAAMQLLLLMMLVDAAADAVVCGGSPHDVKAPLPFRGRSARRCCSDGVARRGRSSVSRGGGGSVKYQDARTFVAAILQHFGKLSPGCL
jgi:hypothetical protein